MKNKRRFILSLLLCISLLCVSTASFANGSTVNADVRMLKAPANAPRSSTYYGTYYDNSKLCVFSVINDAGIWPGNRQLVTNVGYKWYQDDQNGQYTSSDEVHVFVKTDDPGYNSIFSVSQVRVNGATVAGMSYSVPYYDSNVLTSPDWIWDNRYGYDVYNMYGSYQVTGSGALILDGGCIPMAHTLTTTIDVYEQ